MQSDLFSLAYVSRHNAFKGAIGMEGDVQNILASARRNNSVCGVTGGLMVSHVNYAQVLEGPRTSVESIFNKIQRDSRHRDVTVIYFGLAQKREYPDWRMAMAGLSHDASLCVDQAIADPYGAAANKIRAHLISGLGKMSAMRNEDAWQLAKIFLHSLAQPSAATESSRS